MSNNPSKIDTILRLLRRSKGASVAQLQSATGWKPHSIRAMMTKLRKAGHEVARRHDGTTLRYYLTKPGAKA